MGSEHTTGFLFCYTTIGLKTAFQVITNTKNKMLGKVAMVLTLLAALLPMERVEGGTVRSSYFINTPHNQTVTQGERIVLGCEVAPRSSTTSCSWTKSGSELSLDSRHWLEGCSLVIDPVQGSDEGSYVCLVKTSTSQMESRPGSLEVLVEPGVPSILEAREGDWVEVDQGEELLLTCESQGGRPHAELQWRDAEGQRVFGHVQEHITRIGAASTLRFNPLHPMAVTCTAQSETFTKVASSRPLTVQLRRKVEEEEVKIKIGDNKELSCGDHEGTFKWTLNGKPVEGESGKVLSIEDFTADFENSVVRCLQEKVNGETRILRQFKLLTEKAEGKGGSQVRKPIQLQQTSEPGLQYDQPAQIVSEKPIASGNVFTCVSEGEEDTGEAEYVWVNGRLEKKVKKGNQGKVKQGKGKALKCKLVTGGVRKVKAMEKKLKAISKDLKRFSRILGQLSSPGGER